MENVGFSQFACKTTQTPKVYTKILFSNSKNVTFLQLFSHKRRRVRTPLFQRHAAYGLACHEGLVHEGFESDHVFGRCLQTHH